MACDQGNLAIGMTKKRLLSENTAFDFVIPADRESMDDRLKVEFVESGGYCALEIAGYSPDEKIINLNKRDRETIAESLKNDPLCLIDSWSLDTAYDGKLHKNQLSFVRGKNGIETKYNGKFEGHVSLIVRDIFGGEIQWVK